MCQIRAKVAIVTVSFIIIAAMMSPTNAECCPNAIALIPNCYSAYECFEYICADGTLLSRDDNYCGFGACNLFGCNCDGGCRQNSKGYDEEEARRLYRLRIQKHH